MLFVYHMTVVCDGCLSFMHQKGIVLLMTVLQQQEDHSDSDTDTTI